MIDVNSYAYNLGWNHCNTIGKNNPYEKNSLEYIRYEAGYDDAWESYLMDEEIG